MNKQVILVTGTPCVGKTTLAKGLTEELNGEYVNLTELAESQGLILEKDQQRDTLVIDDAKMRRRLKKLIEKSSNTSVIIDGHYAAAVTPKMLVTNVFVLRRNPEQLREFMIKRGYNQQKQSENLSAEILDVCLMEALQKQDKEKICELDCSDKTLAELLSQVKAVIEGKQQCSVGSVDWLGMLEFKGKTDQYLK